MILDTNGQIDRVKDVRRSQEVLRMKNILSNAQERFNRAANDAKYLTMSL